MKKYLALALAIIMILALSVPALAADLTITPTNTNTAHTYWAYQVFSGTKGTITNGSGELNGIQWGNGVNGTTLLAALTAKTDGTNYDYPAFKDCTDAADVAAVLATFSNNSSEIQAFADLVSKHLSTTYKEGTAAAGEAVTITGLGDGYYFVKDKAATQDGEYGTYSDFMLYVVGDTNVNAKDSTVTLEKKIDENGGVKTTNGSIGDNVPFVLTSTVPNMDAYEAYKFEITDTMSKGLTFNDDVTIKIGTGEAATTLSRVYKGTDNLFYASEEAAAAMAAGTNVTAGYTVESTTDSDGITTLKIYVVNFIQYKLLKGSAIEVKYSATINQDAVVTGDDANTGNVNTASLTYSNNPNETGTGTNGEPVGPEGETPDSQVTVYTTGLELLKVDGQDTGKELAGAVFELTGTSKNVVITQGEIFVRDDTEGTYWRLKDGTYTTDDPATPGMDTTQYEDTSKKYKKVTVIDTTYNASTLTSEATAVTGTDGIITYAGLGEGLYTITEKVAPVGYNPLEKPIYVFVKFVPSADGATGTFKTYKYTGSENPPTAPTGDPDTSVWTLLSDGANTSTVEFDLQVENNSGSTLPSTGGIGTTIFYVLGGLLVACAGVLLITKTRMRREG